MKKRDESTGGEREVEVNDIIQVNQKVEHWFRCLLVVDEVKGWGVLAYCTIPGNAFNAAGDAFMRLEWEEFDLLGAKSLWRVAPAEG
jgi:hypothetical protein